MSNGDFAQPMLAHQRSIFRDGLAEAGKVKFGRQHLKFLHRQLKDGSLWLPMRSRRPSHFTQLISFIGPVLTLDKAPWPSDGMTSTPNLA